MDRAREQIRQVLAEAEHPAVLSSFGKDSMLLLALVREVDKSVPVVWFHTGQTREQERFARSQILALDLHVWSWAPSDVYLVPNDRGLTLIREQAFGPSRLPVLSDVEEGQSCIFDFPAERTPELYPHFTHLFLGYKDSDHHSSLGGSGFCPQDEWRLGKAKVYSPLRHMTDAEVWAAIRELGVPVDEERYERSGRDPDTIQACTRCLEDGEGDVLCPKTEGYIPRVRWDAEGCLDAFRSKFGFKEISTWPT